MANTSEADWDESTPVITDARRLGAGEILNLRKSARLRIAKEHILPAGASVGGEHKAGSGLAYYAGVAPTLRPDGSSSLSSQDAGRLWVNSTTKEVKVWTGAAWAAMEALADTPVIEHFYQALTTNPQTISGLSAGTWLVFVSGYIYAGGAYTVSVTVNTQNRTLPVANNNSNIGAPFMIPFMSVSVSGAGTISVEDLTASGTHTLFNATGIRIA